MRFEVPYCRCRSKGRWGLILNWAGDFFKGRWGLFLDFVWNFFKGRRGLILKVEIGPQGASCGRWSLAWVVNESARICFLRFVDFPQLRSWTGLEDFLDSSNCWFSTAYSWTGFDSRVVDTWSCIGLVISSRAVEAWFWIWLEASSRAVKAWFLKVDSNTWQACTRWRWRLVALFNLFNSHLSSLVNGMIFKIDGFFFQLVTWSLRIWFKGGETAHAAHNA